MRPRTVAGRGVEQQPRVQPRAGGDAGDGLAVDGSDVLKHEMGGLVILALPVGDALEGEENAVHGVGVAPRVVDDGISQLGQDSQHGFADPILPRPQHLQIGKT